ncbi:MAG TPA: XRE family transcriptional regulator [Caldisericia bacterium]|nr:XRE family transcriptional regulator [Caldisericia bacterium]
MGSLAKVNPKILMWARETAKMSIETVANKINVSETKIETWEKGEACPTVKQAQRLAKMYRRPFALFFFPDLPKDFHPLRDFRRKTSIPIQTGSVFIIREIQQKQAWMRVNLIEDKKVPLPFVGKFTIQDKPFVVAKHMIDTLEAEPNRIVKNQLPLNHWIDKVQKIGINVSRSSFIHSNLLIDPEELQGFAIVDPYAPFIFINSKDWESAQLFTLVHELAHIWIGESGISNEINCSKEEKTRLNMDPVELFCSEVSANVLMPEDFMRSITISSSDKVRDICRVSKNLGLSCFALLYRLKNLGMISKEDYFNIKSEFDERFNDYVEAQKIKTKKPKNTPLYYTMTVNKNGKLFIQTVLNAYRSGEIEVSQASYLLNVKANNLSKLEDHAFRRVS